MANKFTYAMDDRETYSDAIMIIPQETIVLPHHDEALHELQTGCVHIRASDAIVVPLVSTLSSHLQVQELNHNTTSKPSLCNLKHALLASIDQQDGYNSGRSYISTNMSVWNNEIQVHDHQTATTMELTKLPRSHENTMQVDSYPIPNMLGT